MPQVLSLRPASFVNKAIAPRAFHAKRLPRLAAALRSLPFFGEIKSPTTTGSRRAFLFMKRNKRRG